MTSSEFPSTREALVREVAGYGLTAEGIEGGGTNSWSLTVLGVTVFRVNTSGKEWSVFEKRWLDGSDLTELLLRVADMQAKHAASQRAKADQLDAKARDIRHALAQRRPGQPK